ncbi:carotenoid oxygenase [Fennellomyces sp. T-0311]|nr:carotenoid oxygenase [Fennellomyces sp. T-0311]
MVLLHMSTELERGKVTKPVWQPVQGTIPSWLNGVLYRVGGGKFGLGKDGQEYVIRHAFDGLPYVHRFELSAEKQAVRYNNRLTAEGVERSLVADPEKSSIFFGHVQKVSPLRSISNLWSRIDKMVLRPQKPTFENPADRSVGVTVTPNFPLPASFRDNDKVVVSKTDANALQQVHADTLEPKRLFNYSDYDERLHGPISAAHHQVDFESQESFNFSIAMGKTPCMTAFSINKDGKATVLGQVTERKLPNGETLPFRPSYIHAFWMTKNFVIIPEFPLHYGNNGMDMIIQSSLAGGMIWDESSPTYLHVISRDPKIGHVVSMPVDPFFTFHSGNAWDTVDAEGNTVIELDCCAFPNGNFVRQLHRFGVMDRPGFKHPELEKAAKMRGMEYEPGHFIFGDLHRYRATFNTKNKTGETTLSKIATNVEFPRFHPSYIARPNKYLWGCQAEPVSADDSQRFSLVKIDLDTGNLTKHDRPAHMFTEPVFVPNPDGKSEDDGAILSFTNILDIADTTKDRCILSILDAKTMEEIGRCDVGPFNATTFHGSFVDAEFKSITVN